MNYPYIKYTLFLTLLVMGGGLILQGCSSTSASQTRQISTQKPRIVEEAVLTFAPEVPPPIKRREPAIIKVNLFTTEEIGVMMDGLERPTEYLYWTFNGGVPGPFIRARVGDVLQVTFTNDKNSRMAHNVDFHAVTGTGGGGEATITPPGQQTEAEFRLLNPGLFIYHCAVPPVPHHVANGMYGLILVEPEEGLPPVDREYYILQSEFYTEGPFGAEGLQQFSPEKGSLEQPTYVVFNGHVGALMGDGKLKANVGETVRLFVGNGGPNLVSSFHVIGEIFDRVYAEGSTSNPFTDVQTTLIPAGGSTMVEFTVEVPGTYTLVDHSIFRIEKGAVGMLEVDGPERSYIYKKKK